MHVVNKTEYVMLHKIAVGAIVDEIHTVLQFLGATLPYSFYLYQY